MKKSIRTIISAATILMTLAAAGCGGSSGATKQETAKTNFPTKPVTIIVPYAAGGGTDLCARALAKSTEKYLGKSITIVNKTGGAGAVGLTEGSGSKPDGYTATMVTVELTTLRHLGLANNNYKDFKPICLINYDPSAITVKADAPWKTAKEFIDYAKAHPGELKEGNSGPGAIWHLSAAGLEKAADVKFTHVPFDGAAPAITALMGGHVDVVFVSPAEVKSQVESGYVRTLAIIDSKQSDALPGVKTLEEETGIKTKNLATWRGIAVPKDTPDDVAKILADAFTKGANDPEFKDYMKKNGLGLFVKDSAGFAEQMANVDAFFAELIPTLGLKK